MRRAERLFRIVAMLREGGVTRAADLAARLEVSARTIYRDVAHLQGSGLPIEGAAGVGYVLRPGFDLPPVTLTRDQVDAVALGLAFAERAGDPGLAHAAREARAKLDAVLPAPALRYAALRATRRASEPHAQAARRAVRDRAVLRLRYRDAAGRDTERAVWPLVLWTLSDGWMLSGWCTLRGDFRTFRLDRVAALAPTGERFPDDPERGLDAFLARDGCA